MKSNILLFDYNNLAKRCVFTPYVKLSDTEVDYNVWRWTVWNSIFATVRKLKATGVILAGDMHSWRKIIYPAYKLDRKIHAKKNQLAGIPDIDWGIFYNEMNLFGKLLSENLPFMHITENHCEADDIIAIIARNINSNFTIISVDSDYRQLTYQNNVKQYDPIKKKIVPDLEDLEYWVQFNSLRGQLKDNIYNAVTPEDFPIEKILLNGEFKNTRKPSLPEKTVNTILTTIGVEKWINEIGPEEARKKNTLIQKENEDRTKPKILWEENVAKRYNKNKTLIDFREIPQSLTSKILTKYQNYNIIKTDDMYPFFKKMGWNDVLDNYSHVESIMFNLF